MKTILLAALLAFSITLLPAQEAPENPILKEVSSKLTHPNKKFSVLIQATVKEGETEKFIAAFAAAIAPTRAEEGCARYELNRIAGENFSFVVHEQWKNLAALKAHMETPHTKKLLETIMPLLEGEPQIVVLTPEGEPKKAKESK
jgi:quinol monooxygenase YgiN